MIIKQTLTTRSKNLGYLTWVHNTETKTKSVIVQRFKGKDPTEDQQQKLDEVQEWIESEFGGHTIDNIRIDNNVYMNLLELDWRKSMSLIWNLSSRTHSLMNRLRATKKQKLPQHKFGSKLYELRGGRWVLIA